MNSMYQVRSHSAAGSTLQPDLKDDAPRSPPNQSVKRTPDALRVFGSLRAAHFGAAYLKRCTAQPKY